MYLITGGQVDIDLDGKHILLGVGHFFGEIAVLQRASRSATVAAGNRCQRKCGGAEPGRPRGGVTQRRGPPSSKHRRTSYEAGRRVAGCVGFARLARK
jgi:hypothetical protein